ncbi:unnamed protein product [Prorocentrum cordatum]|uniref:HEAT repeat domain-containing protein n=1 Tax=Prorocentrum cordatum TaxID=2364126 RepID=A0ABN9W0P6_9DINO|nr:unnamed protein product [Polarella glacialis]
MGSRLEDALVKLEAYDACSVRVGLRTLVDLSGRDAKHSSEIASALLWSGDDEEDVHRAACEALGALGPRLPAAEVSALAGQLRHPRGAVRAAAARALGAVGPAGGSRHADEVAALASDPHEDAQLSGAECLSALGEAQRLAAFVQSSSPPAVRVALLGLGRAAQARLDHAGLIAAQLAHPDAGVRLAACQASGEIGGSCTEEHLARLAAAASAEGEAKVRRAAVQALGRAGGPGVPHLAAFFRDKDEAIRHYAAEVLAQVGGEATASCAAGLLRDASPEVRRAALLALGRTGPAGLHHAAALAERAAADADRAARLAAIQALGEVGAEGQAGAVGQLAGEPDQGIRFAAVCALSGPRARGLLVHQDRPRAEGVQPRR